MKLKKWQNIFHVIVNANSIVQDVIQIKYGIIKHVYVKTEITTYGDKVYNNVRALNVPEDDIECGFLAVIFIGSFLVYETNITCKYI